MYYIKIKLPLCMSAFDASFAKSLSYWFGSTILQRGEFLILRSNCLHVIQLNIGRQCCQGTAQMATGHCCAMKTQPKRHSHISREYNHHRFLHFQSLIVALHNSADRSSMTRVFRNWCGAKIMLNRKLQRRPIWWIWQRPKKSAHTLHASRRCERDLTFYSIVNSSFWAARMLICFRTTTYKLNVLFLTYCTWTGKIITIIKIKLHFHWIWGKITRPLVFISCFIRKEKIPNIYSG